MEKAKRVEFERRKELEAALKPRYNITDDDGIKHTCELHAFKVRPVPHRGVFLELWFVSEVWYPDRPLYGPYIYGILDGRVRKDERMDFVNVSAEAKLREMLARAQHMRYQSTPLLRVGGDTSGLKVYSRG